MLIRLREMLIKEFIQVYRDPRMRFMLVAPLVVQALLYGYAANYTVRHVATAIVDLDHTEESREFVSRFGASSYFRVVAQPKSGGQLQPLIDRGEIQVAIQILPGFAEKMREGQTADVLAALDGTNSNTALLALGYINDIGRRYSTEYRTDYIQRRTPQLLMTMPAVEFEQRPWFNEALESQWFFVPGTIGLLMMAVVVSMTAFTIVRERELGTLEQLMVTPMRSFELILGKTIPNFIIAIAQFFLVTAIAIFWFQVPFRGSVVVLLIGSVLYILSILALGLLISTASATQQQALVAAFFIVLPAGILSGFGYPISSMPQVLQWLTYVDPLRHYLVVVRSVFLKGTGLSVLWPQMVAMAILGAVLLTASVSRFRKHID